METNVRPKFEGETVKLGDAEYVVPSLSIRQAKEHWSIIQTLGKQASPETIPERLDGEISCIFSAMSRNYPDLTKEALLDLIEVKNVHTLFRIVVGQSGLLARPGSEPAAVETIPSNGAPSTDASSSEPAGPSNT